MILEDAPETAPPHCPFCKKELDRIWIKRKGLGWIEQQKVLMCPYCRAFLSYGTFSWS